MVQENEIVTLLLGLGVLIFVILFFPRLKSFPHSIWLFLAVMGQAVAWIFTVLETWYFPNLFNSIEHFGYAFCAICLLVWALLSVRVSGEQR